MARGSRRSIRFASLALELLTYSVRRARPCPRATRRYETGARKKRNGCRTTFLCDCLVMRRFRRSAAHQTTDRTWLSPRTSQTRLANAGHLAEGREPLRAKLFESNGGYGYLLGCGPATVPTTRNWRSVRQTQSGWARRAQKTRRARRCKAPRVSSPSRVR